jgi:hypothetical protein
VRKSRRIQEKPTAVKATPQTVSSEAKMTKRKT